MAMSVYRHLNMSTNSSNLQIVLNFDVFTVLAELVV